MSSSKLERIIVSLVLAKNICVFSENELKIKIAELNEAISNLRMTISSLEEKIAKEESYKLEAIECCRKEKEARNEAEQMKVSLTTELEKVSNAKSAVEQKAIANEEMYKTSQEFNNRLLHKRLMRCISDWKQRNQVLLNTLALDCEANGWLVRTSLGFDACVWT
ncbi:kinesin protein KIN-14N [Trifolium repens]|nr:kinesin protein KIN-14N [Trifolium repens]